MATSKAMQKAQEMVLRGKTLSYVRIVLAEDFHLPKPEIDQIVEQVRVRRTRVDYARVAQVVADNLENYQARRIGRKAFCTLIAAQCDIAESTADTILSTLPFTIAFLKVMERQP